MAMNQVRVGLLVALLVGAAPLTAWAQPKAGQPAKAAADPKKESKEVDLDKETAGDDEKPDSEKPEGEGGEGGEGEGLGDICKIDPAACPQIDFDKAAARPLNVQMYAVQQIYALRNKRFEINPYFAATLNDQFVSHPGPGLTINWYITNVLALGINGNLYAGMNSTSAFNFQTTRAARIGLPITEYQWNANANLSYVPAYGKFAGFSDFIFHYDFYAIAGVGAISTRPIAVVDPDNRTFQFEPKLAFNVGIGMRIFFNRWFAATLEIRDYLFVDKLENTNIAEGIDANGVPNARNPETWLGGDSFTNNVQAQIGLAVFLPPTWEYKLPK